MKYKTLFFSLSFGAALTLSPLVVKAQDFSKASENALDALQGGSEDYAKELIPSQASGSALLEVGGFAPGSNEEDAEKEQNIQYKYNPKKGPKGLQGAHMPERLFRVPYSGRP